MVFRVANLQCGPYSIVHNSRYSSKNLTHFDLTNLRNPWQILEILMTNFEIYILLLASMPRIVVVLGMELVHTVGAAG